MTYPELLAFKNVLGKLLKLRGDLPPTAPQPRQDEVGKANDQETDKDTAHGQKQAEKPRKTRVTSPGIDASNVWNPNAPGGPNAPMS